MSNTKTYVVGTQLIQSRGTPFQHLTFLRKFLSSVGAVVRTAIDELLHPPASRIPFLDGLRSIAVLLVIDGHITSQFVRSNGSSWYSSVPIVANGWIGVDLFFVLSGFFIGGQLWKELRDSGSINVPRFILRRGFRIWPLYFFTFFCAFVSSAFLGAGLSAKEYGWSDLVFITNVHNRGVVEGSWSLCTEEQFYIIAPLILFLVAQRWGSQIRAVRWLWAVLFTVPLIRTILWTTFNFGGLFSHSAELWGPIYTSSLTHCDGLVIGLIVAYHWYLPRKPRQPGSATPVILAVLGFGALVGLHQFQKEVFDFTGLAFLFGSITWLGLRRRIPIFDSRIFYWISRLSYGMYLNHEYFCPWVRSLFRFLPLPASLSNILAFVVITALSFAISFVTFALIEHPFLQMRKTLLEPRMLGIEAGPLRTKRTRESFAG